MVEILGFPLTKILWWDQNQRKVLQMEVSGQKGLGFGVPHSICHLERRAAHVAEILGDSSAELRLQAAGWELKIHTRSSTVPRLVSLVPGYQKNVVAHPRDRTSRTGLEDPAHMGSAQVMLP